MIPIDTNVLLVALFAVVIICIAWIVRLEIRLERLVRGKSGASLEDSIRQTLSEIETLHSSRKDLARYLEGVEDRLRKGIRKVETVRFNPFKGSGEGGNQSFTTALLNEDGDGMLLSAIYSRDRVNIYAKPVSRFASTVTLSEEETGVLEKAKNG